MDERELKIEKLEEKIKELEKIIKELKINKSMLLDRLRRKY